MVIGGLDEGTLNFGSFRTCLNEVSAVGLARSENDSVLWGFISKYQAGLTPENSPLLAQMVDKAINYYNDFIKKNKKYREATEAEKSALLELANELKKVGLAKQNDAGELQNLVFQIGKNHGYEKNMREWFLALYQILLGQDQGPRMGSFIALFGIDNFVKLVGEKV